MHLRLLTPRLIFFSRSRCVGTALLKATRLSHLRVMVRGSCSLEMNPDAQSVDISTYPKHRMIPQDTCASVVSYVSQDSSETRVESEYHIGSGAMCWAGTHESRCNEDTCAGYGADKSRVRRPLQLGWAIGRTLFLTRSGLPQSGRLGKAVQPAMPPQRDLFARSDRFNQRAVFHGKSEVGET